MAAPTFMMRTTKRKRHQVGKIVLGGGVIDETSVDPRHSTDEATARPREADVDSGQPASRASS